MDLLWEIKKNNICVPVLIFSILLSSCSIKTKNNNFNDVEEPLPEEGVWVETLCARFFYNEEFYDIIDVKKTEYSNLHFFKIGYLINNSDLNFWRDKDKDSTLCYACDLSNSLYRKDSDENLLNRFELYEVEEYDFLLSVKDLFGFNLYKLEGIE